MAHHDVEVKVVLHAPGSKDAYHFESKDLPIGPGNHIYFSNCGKKKGFRIRYVLDDDGNPGYRFPTKKSHPNTYLEDALWVTESGGCPTLPCKWEEVFRAEDVEDQGRTLVVFNENLKVQNFAYSLRVWNGTDWLLLDPPGSNQNGGVRGFTSYAIGLASGGVAALGTAALTLGEALSPSDGLAYAVGGAVVGLIIGFILDRT